MNKFLGIDVGGTEIKFAIVDDNGMILSRDKIRTDNKKRNIILDLQNIIKKNEAQISGVGVSFPGFIDSDNGILRTAGALSELEGINLRWHLSEVTDLPIYIENDAKCVAISEQFTGAAKYVDDFICITVGTGIGGAVVLDRKLVKGHNFSAGEFGFMITDIDTDLILSTNAGIRSQREKYAVKHNVDFEKVTGQQAFSDNEIYQRFLHHLAAGIFNLIYILNPEKILIGGSISKDNEFMNDLIYKVEELRVDKNVTYIIEACENKNNAGLLGAVYELKKNFKI